MTKLDKVKTHLKDNGKTYIVGTVCVIVGAIAAVLISGDETNAEVIEGDIDISATNNINALFNYKPTATNVVISQLERRGHPGNVVQCKETGEVFASQGRAADLLNLDRFKLSKHLRGEEENVGGLHFEKLGEAA